MEPRCDTGRSKAYVKRPDKEGTACFLLTCGVEITK